MNKSFYRWFSLFLMLCFSGCFTGLSDSVSAKSDKLITVSGSVRSIGAVPSSLASLHDAPRTAFPSVPEGVAYKVVAVKDDDSSKKIDATVVDADFSINLKAGTWRFYVQGKAGDNLIFEGTKEIELTEKDSTIDGFEITVKPKVTGNGTGTVSLKIARDGTEVTNKINKIVAKWTQGGDLKTQTLDSWSNNAVFFNMKPDDETSPVQIKSGSYTVGFTFYDENDAVLFFCAEVVNIFDNMQTDSWVSASTHDDGSYITSDGKFKITGALVQGFVATTLYVNGEGGTIGTDGDDDKGTGGYFAPFKTVSKAATVINASPKPNALFTIYVSGKTEEDLQIAINRNITIQGLSATAIIQRKDTNGETMIKVDSGNTLTMQDITLDGNEKELSSNLYMGIYISGTANLNNCRIINCHSPNSNGGAIYVSTEGAVTMKGVNIENCKAQNGGGIYVYNGTLTMNGGSIQKCTASGGGGGVFISQNGKMFMYGSAVIGDSSKNTVATGENACSNYATESGGGIYNAGKLYLGYSEANDDGSPNTDTASTLDGGIYYNYSTTDGGGIRNNGTLYMNSGTIAYNGAGRNGGGVYVASTSGEVTINGVNLENNTSQNNGGGLAIGYGYNGTLNIINSTIKNNEIKSTDSVSTYCGAGLFVENTECTLNITGTTKIEDNIIDFSSSSAENKSPQGAGLWLGNNATTKIESNVEITGNNCTDGTNLIGQGGGIYISGGTLYMNGKLQGNKAYDGGGIYVDNGAKFMMSNGSIKTCEAKNNGGAIYLKGASSSNKSTATISGESQIDRCKSTNGSAIYIFKNAKVTVEGNAVIGNENGFLQNGDGIPEQGNLAATQGTIAVIGEFELTGSAKICGNRANDYGGGVLVTKSSDGGSIGTFKMSGGKISGNSAGNKGSGIYHNGASLNMSGSATVDSSNVIYLTNSGTNLKTINVAGDLDAGIRATIEPQTYTLETKVLTAGDDVTLADQVGKFLIKENDSQGWTLDDDGRLFNSLQNITFDKIQGKDNEMTTDTIADDYTALLNKIIYYKTSDGNYGAMIIIPTDSISFYWKTQSHNGGNVNLKTGFQTGWGFDLDGGATNDNNKDFGLDSNSGVHKFKSYNNAKFYIVE